MNPEAKKVFASRVKSLLWRAGMMAAVFLVDFTSENIGLFNLSPQVLVVAGLVLGEVSKFLNSNLPELRKSNPV